VRFAAHLLRIKRTEYSYHSLSTRYQTIESSGSEEERQCEDPINNSSTDSRQRVCNGLAGQVVASHPPATAAINYDSTKAAHSQVVGTSLTPARPCAGLTSPPTLNPPQRPTLNPPQRPSASRLLADSIVRNVLLSYLCLAFTSMSNDVILALWMFLDIKDGGVGLTVSQTCSLISWFDISAWFRVR